MCLSCVFVDLISQFKTESKKAYNYTMNNTYYLHKISLMKVVYTFQKL